MTSKTTPEPEDQGQEDVGVYDVTVICGDSIDVKVPSRYGLEFLGEFGQTFAFSDGKNSAKNIRPADNYYEFGGYWYIIVTIESELRESFFSFLRAFCNERNLSFDDSVKYKKIRSGGNIKVVIEQEGSGHPARVLIYDGDKLYTTIVAEVKNGAAGEPDTPYASLEEIKP